MTKSGLCPLEKLPENRSDGPPDAPSDGSSDDCPSDDSLNASLDVSLEEPLENVDSDFDECAGLERCLLGELGRPVLNLLNMLGSMPDGGEEMFSFAKLPLSGMTMYG